MAYVITTTTLAVYQGLCKVSHYPTPGAPSWVLISSVILSHISQSLQTHLAMVCSHCTKLSYEPFRHSFRGLKFNEGRSEIGGEAVPHHGASASRLIYQDTVFVSGLFIWDQ